MPPKARGERNETILVDRKNNLEHSVVEKSAMLNGIFRRIKQLNHDNEQKEEAIRGLEEQIRDLVEKHEESVQLVRAEADGAREAGDYESLVLREEVARLERLMAHCDEMESETKGLRGENVKLLDALRECESVHAETMRETKREILKQESKLEKAFKKELVLMDSKYRQQAFECLNPVVKETLLENSKLLEEIVMQKIGIVNLAERLSLEGSMLSSATSAKRELLARAAQCDGRIAQLRRSSYAYESRMADMDVTAVTLAAEEEAWEKRVAAFPSSRGDLNREAARLKEEAQASEARGRKWKSRIIACRSMVSKEIERKRAAMGDLSTATATLPDEPPDDLAGTNDWTLEMTRQLAAARDISSTDFERTFRELTDAWREEDGMDTIHPDGSRPTTTNMNGNGNRPTSTQQTAHRGLMSTSPRRQGALSVAGGGGGFGMKLSLSVPFLPPNRGGGGMQPSRGLKAERSAPNLSLSSAGGAGGGAGDKRPMFQAPASFPTAASPADDDLEEKEGFFDLAPVRPMFLRASNRCILDDDADAIARLEGYRKLREAARLAEEGKSIGMKVDISDFNFGGEESPDKIHKETRSEDEKSERDSVEDWLDKFHRSNRLDISLTGMAKKSRTQTIGVAALESKDSGRKPDFPPGLAQNEMRQVKTHVGEGPRKRLAALLGDYKDVTKRREMWDDLKRDERKRALKASAPWPGGGAAADGTGMRQSGFANLGKSIMSDVGRSSGGNNLW